MGKVKSSNLSHPHEINEGLTSSNPVDQKKSKSYQLRIHHSILQRYLMRIVLENMMDTYWIKIMK